MAEIGATFFGEAVSERSFPLVVTDLPYLLDHPGEGFRVEGEIFLIPETGWDRLDRLEGHPEFYRRRIEQFVCANQAVDAWVYFLVREIPELLEIDPVRRFGNAGNLRRMT